VNKRDAGGKRQVVPWTAEEFARRVPVAVTGFGLDRARRFAAALGPDPGT
jgi:hypothetical protein